MGGYAQVSAAGLYGSGQDGQVPAAFGIAVPVGAAAQVGPAEPGTGAAVVAPRDFFRSSGFGLLLLIALVIYFDVRVLNR